MSDQLPVIDFSAVPSMDPVPNGDYEAEVVHAEVGTSKAGYPKIDLRWKIIGGEHDGRQIFDSLSFHPNALFRVKQVLQAFDFANDFSGSVDPEELVGQTAMLKVALEPGTDVDPNTGEPYPARNRIKKVSRL